MLVTRITEPNNAPELRKTALDALSNEIRSSTSSMTAIPKPLKFLRPHYETLVKFYDQPEARPIQVKLSKIPDCGVMANTWRVSFVCGLLISRVAFD